MANEHESTMKWKVDVGQLKKAMQDAKRSISQANAEFKTATAGMDRWSKSTDGLEAKIAQLNKTLPQQRTILEQLEKQYELTAKNMGENSKEAADLKLKIEAQKATIIKTETSIGRYTDQLADMEKKQAESETASGKLNKAIAEQQDQLDDLKKSYSDAVIMYGKNSDEAKDLAKQIEDLSGELADNKKRMADADKAADDLDKSLDDVADSAEESGEGFTIMKGALAELVAKGITAAINGLKNLATAAYEAWGEFDDGADAIIAATGATGKAAEDLADVYDKVSSNVLDDFGNIGTAIGEVNTRFGLTGDALQDVSEKFLKFSKLNGVDVKSSIDSVQAAMEAFGVSAEQTGDFLDMLNKAGQDTGVSVDKLAQDMVTNAAALDEMGFSASDAAMFMANLNKNGADASAVMAGLKKALANASKEGKPMSEAMEDIEKSIKDAGDETKAINKATELFGSKAGASIAKAVREGRLSFDKFGTTLDDFRGNIETTYDAMLDAPDEIGLAVQNLRKTAAKAVDQFFQQHGSKITKLVNDFTNNALPKLEKAISDAFDFISEHGDDVVDVLKSIAVAFVTYKAVSNVMAVVEAFKAVKTAIEAGNGVMQALNVTMSASPYALLAAGIAGLSFAFFDYAKKQHDAELAQYALNDAQQEAIDKVVAMTEKYNALDEARNTAVENINSEFGYIRTLKDEYNSLIDENGKVKEGYEDRASFIMNQLAKAMGMEVDQVQELIDQNGKLGDAIDEIIRKKQAEAVLAANEEIYNEAIRNRSQALADLSEAQKALDDAEQKYQQTNADTQAFWAEYERLLKDAPQVAQDYFNANASIIEANETAKKSYEEAKGKVEDAEGAWIGYNTTIKNYEGLASAIISGDADKINSAMQDMTNNFITAETGNRESLERQVKNYEDNLANLEAAIEKGTPGVTQEMVDQARSMVDAANAELDKLPPEASATGEDAGKRFSSGVGEQAYLAKRSGEMLLLNVTTGATDTGEGKATGNAFGEGYASGAESKSGDAEDAGKELAASAVKGAKSENDGGAVNSGKNFTQGFIDGIKNNSLGNTLWNTAKSLAKKALNALKAGQQEGSPSKLTRKSGVFFGQGYQLGIQSMVRPVSTTARNLASKAVDALGSNLDMQMREIGADGGNSLIQGMNDVIPDMSASIGTLKANVAASNASVLGSSSGSFGSVMGGSGGNTQNVTFNQTINSPKPVDRLTLYRETNSLLFGAKVRLQNV